MNRKTILAVIFASSILISSAVVTIKPIQLTNAQIQNSTNNTATLGMANATGKMTSTKISGASSVAPSPPVRAAVSAEPIVPSAAQLKELEQQVNETFGGYPRGVARAAAAPHEAIKPPTPNTASVPSTAPPPLDINASNIDKISNTTGNTNFSSSASSSQNVSKASFTLPVKLYASTAVTPVDPRSTIDEPSLANNGPIVFYTGNWYA